MEKTKTVIMAREVAAMKRIMANINPLVQKRDKLMEKVNDLNQQIEPQCQYFENKFGNRIEDMIIKVVIPQVDAAGQPKVNEKGVQLTTTKYDINPNVLVWSETAKAYVFVAEQDAVELAETVGTVDETETVEEVETPATEAAFNPIEG